LIAACLHQPLSSSNTAPNHCLSAVTEVPFLAILGGGYKGGESGKKREKMFPPSCSKHRVAKIFCFPNLLSGSPGCQKIFDHVI
jgi:hypothetical protein